MADDYCSDYIAYFEARIRFIKITHKYMHDPDCNLPQRPTKQTSVVGIIGMAKMYRAILGAEVTDEIIQAVAELNEIAHRLGIAT